MENIRSELANSNRRCESQAQRSAARRSNVARCSSPSPLSSSNLIVLEHPCESCSGVGLEFEQKLLADFQCDLLVSQTVDRS